MAQRILLVLVAVAAVVGFSFASVSTSDFVAHLDRQVHGIHCSFLPGVDAPDVTGSSGCHVTLMSPYSSVLRDRVWGVDARQERAKRRPLYIIQEIAGDARDQARLGYVADATANNDKPGGKGKRPSA